MNDLIAAARAREAAATPGPSYPSFAEEWPNTGDCCYGNYDDAHSHGRWLGLRAAAAARNDYPLLLDVLEAAQLLMSMHEQLGPQFIPHDELALRAAIEAWKAAQG
jgi:hypothetical protein